MHHSESESFPWGKAILCGLALALFLLLLFGRSSCFAPPSTTEQRESSSETGENEVASSEDSTEAKPEDVSSSEKEPEADKTSKDSAANDEPPPTDDLANSDNTNEPNSTGSPPEGSEPPNGTGPGATTSSTEAGAGYQVGGLNVIGERLGVILDISESMQRYLPELRSEIGAKFRNANFLEVEGCLLEPSSNREELPASRRYSVMNAMRELVEADKVDSIYWFCDLQDERTDQALAELRALLIEPDSGSPTRLYVRSTDDLPGKTLADIIATSGGAFEKRR